MSENKSFEIRGAEADRPGKNDRQARVQTLHRIKEVREGRQESFSLLLEQYKPLIESAVARFCQDEITELNREDLRQEASLCFYNSILTYDTEQEEVEFGLYAKICITNGLVSRLRRVKSRTPWDPLDTLDGGGEMSLSLQDFEDPTVRILEQERLSALYSVIRKCLSDYEYRVWSLYMSGRSAAEIGAAVGREEKSVSNAIYRIRKKLRAELQ